MSAFDPLRTFDPTQERTLRQRVARYSGRLGQARPTSPERLSEIMMIGAFRRRYLDLLGSIYIYNEHRGYTAIDRVLEAVRARSPDDEELIAAVEHHRADERA